ncbi:MAG: ubiquinol oxidase subunit II [Chlamydiia bacterium]|nr:ubiquinol oxidase subunit II [Chlamydiia bacterium]
MKISAKPVLFMLVVSGLIFLLILAMQPLEIYAFKEYIAVLFPKGNVGIQQRDLLVLIQVLMLFVIVPVYILTFLFSWWYRADNKRATYDPDLVDNTVAEFVWWGVPCLMMIFIGGITWIKTVELDPYKSIASDKKPIVIEAVALQWNWLFIYPEEKIASLNYLQFPKETPLKFQITADAPMNSLWIPFLGGQIYAMPAMKTELNLIANEEGTFPGYSANISGEGFASMRFKAMASTEEEFQEWVKKAADSGNSLTYASYEELAKPTIGDPVELYQLADEHLFHKIIMKYMQPPSKQE